MATVGVKGLSVQRGFSRVVFSSGLL